MSDVDIITLYCLVYGDPVDNAFPIDVHKSKTVGHLKQLIKQEKHPYFVNIPSDKLTLWSVSISLQDDTALEQFELHDKDAKNVRKLLPYWKLEKIFQSELLDEHVHVIVEHPPIAAQTPMPPLIDIATVRRVHVFVDNSNVWIQGKRAVAQLEKLSAISIEYTKEFKLLRIDYGRLLTTVLGDRPLGPTPILVASRPPANDSLWSRYRQQGYRVEVFDRNASNREKMVDATLICTAMKDIMSQSPGILVLVAGDGDYDPLITEALERGWEIETWFWTFGMNQRRARSCPNSLRNNSPSVGLSGHLKSRTEFKALDDYYKTFSFGYGPDFYGNMHVLEMSGEKLREWTDAEVMNCFIVLNMFGWWEWIDAVRVNLIFKTDAQLEGLKSWMEAENPEITVKVKPPEKKSKQHKRSISESLVFKNT